MAPKLNKRRSSIATERAAAPSSPSISQHGPNFIVNVHRQRAVQPTSWCGRGEWTTTNPSGTADTRGVGAGFDSGTLPADHGTVKVTD